MIRARLKIAGGIKQGRAREVPGSWEEAKGPLSVFCTFYIVHITYIIHIICINVLICVNMQKLCQPTLRLLINSRLFVVLGGESKVTRGFFHSVGGHHP